VADREDCSHVGSIDVHRQHYNVTFTLLALAAVAYALLQSLVAPALLAIQHDLRTTTAGAAWILSAYLLSASVVTPIAGRLGDMLGKKLPLLLGSQFSCAAFALLAAAHGSDWEIYTAMLLLGVGIGFAFASMANLIVEAVPGHQTGVATGMNTIVRTIGGAIGSQVTAGIVTATVAANALPTENGFTIAFAASAAALAVGFVVALGVPSREDARTIAGFRQVEVGEWQRR
jgi:MFS family permease